MKPVSMGDEGWENGIEKLVSCANKGWGKQKNEKRLEM
jgi:hypothetical protein